MLTKEEFVKTHPDVREGMTAYTTDGEKLGVIERVDEDNLTIERGWFFHKDFLIPYDDIEDIREDQVIIRQRRQEFEDRMMKEESWDTGEADLSGRASEVGERAKGRVEETGERAKEAGEHLSEEMSPYGGRREEEMRGYGRGRVEEKEQARIPLREEELEAQKRAKESEVNIRKEVRTETKRMDIPVQKEDVVIERRSVSETEAEDLGGKAFEQEDIRIPLKEEEVEVTKRPVVKEEVRVGKETRTENQPVSGEVRKEEVKVSAPKPADKKEKK